MTDIHFLIEHDRIAQKEAGRKRYENRKRDKQRRERRAKRKQHENHATVV